MAQQALASSLCGVCIATGNHGGDQGFLTVLCFDRLCFIECFVHRDDCSKELLEWGSRVASANSRPPNPQ